MTDNWGDFSVYRILFNVLETFEIRGVDIVTPIIIMDEVFQ